MSEKLYDPSGKDITKKVREAHKIWDEQNTEAAAGKKTVPGGGGKKKTYTPYKD